MGFLATPTSPPNCTLHKDLVDRQWFHPGASKVFLFSLTQMKCQCKCLFDYNSAHFFQRLWFCKLFIISSLKWNVITVTGRVNENFLWRNCFGGPRSLFFTQISHRNVESPDREQQRWPSPATSGQVTYTESVISGQLQESWDKTLGPKFNKYNKYNMKLDSQNQDVGVRPIRHECIPNKLNSDALFTVLLFN